MTTELGFRPNLDGHHDVSLDLLRHINRRTEQTLAATAVRLDQVHDPASAHAHGQAVREAVLTGLGGLPERTPRPPPATWGGPRPAMGCIVEQLVLESLPHVPVPATLYRPAGRPDSPRPAVLFVCGHTTGGRADPTYQAVCARLARAGIVVLAIDPWGQGERLGYLDAGGAPRIAAATAEHTYAGLQAWWLGQSVARWFVHDAGRGIDLLTALSDVDVDRIGITGNSGGGTLCTWMAAVEDRLAAAAIGTFVTSRGDYLWSGQHQDAEQVLLSGTVAGVDHADLVAAMAPRPVTVLAAEFDFFPMEGTIRSVERARTAYRALGAADALQLRSAPVTHGYAPALSQAAAEMFCEVFGLARPPVETEPPPPLSAHEMRALPSGQVAIDVQGARFLHDLVRAEAQSAPRPEPANARTWLRARVRAHREPPAAPYTRWLPGPEGTLHGMWRSEADLWGAGVLLPAGSAPPEEPRPLRILLLDGGTPVLSTAHPAYQSPGQEAMLAVDVRGRGALAPHDKNGRDPREHTSAVYKMLCDLLWLGDSLAAGQVYDVTRAIDVALADPYLADLLPGLGPNSPVHLEADGLMAFIAQLAAAVDDRVTTVTVRDETVDPDAILRERYHDHGDGAWQAVIAGLARHAPLPTVRDLLADRLRSVPAQR